MTTMCVLLLATAWLTRQTFCQWFKHWVYVSLSGPVTCNKRACRSVSESENVFFEAAKFAYHGNYRKALRTINKCRAACNLATPLSR
ncbi:hypothetical protein JB92DRAFT_2978158 [Gautieria morchelliformis]|nr:hypothetical protein JB92DRAFT_2978158 [Gautieria morchelliformis]